MNYVIKINGKEHYKNVTKRLEKLGFLSDEPWNIEHAYIIKQKDCHIKVSDKGWYGIHSHDCSNSSKLITIEELENIMNKAKEPIFKKGDKVFTISHGWLTILRYSNTLDGVHYYKVKELDGINISEKIMSFTEYTFQGITQERPIDWNDYIGEWGFFWDEDEEKVKKIDILRNYSPELGLCFITNSEGFVNFQPLTPELKELLTKEGIINE